MRGGLAAGEGVGETERGGSQEREEKEGEEVELSHRAGVSVPRT